MCWNSRRSDIRLRNFSNSDEVTAWWYLRILRDIARRKGTYEQYGENMTQMTEGMWRSSSKIPISIALPVVTIDQVYAARGQRSASASNVPRRAITAPEVINLDPNTVSMSQLMKPGTQSQYPAYPSANERIKESVDIFTPRSRTWDEQSGTRTTITGINVNMNDFGPLGPLAQFISGNDAQPARQPSAPQPTTIPQSKSGHNVQPPRQPPVSRPTTMKQSTPAATTRPPSSSSRSSQESTDSSIEHPFAPVKIHPRRSDTDRMDIDARDSDQERRSRNTLDESGRVRGRRPSPPRHGAQDMLPSTVGRLPIALGDGNQPGYPRNRPGTYNPLYTNVPASQDSAESAKSSRRRKKHDAKGDTDSDPEADKRRRK